MRTPARAVAAGRRGRWALSFADLTLLLLGFFVLLQASNGRQQEIVGGLAQQFGAPANQSERLVARDLFQRGEALLTPAGEKRIRTAAQRFVTTDKRIEIRSIGLDRAASRFIVTDDPDECVEQIAPYVELGFDDLVFHAPGPDQRRFLELFSQDVLPRLRERFG